MHWTQVLGWSIMAMPLIAAFFAMAIIEGIAFAISVILAAFGLFGLIFVGVWLAIGGAA